jgi:hypothetical protein
VSEDFEDFKERVRAERVVRAQRDAAERQIPGERLRREIREAFAGERGRRLESQDELSARRSRNRPPDGKAD